MKESDIVYQVGIYWVANERNKYTVYKDGVTCAESDSSYAKDEDGLSIAKARAVYLHRRDFAKKSVHQHMIDAGQTCYNDNGDLRVEVNEKTAFIMNSWQFRTIVQHFRVQPGDPKDAKGVYIFPREFDPKLASL